MMRRLVDTFSFVVLSVWVGWVFMLGAAWH